MRDMGFLVGVAQSAIQIGCKLVRESHSCQQAQQGHAAVLCPCRRDRDEHGRATQHDVSERAHTSA